MIGLHMHPNLPAFEIHDSFGPGQLCKVYLFAGLAWHTWTVPCEEAKGHMSVHNGDLSEWREKLLAESN